MDIVNEITKITEELIKKSELKTNQLLVVGCSTSEIIGGVIGHNSSFDTGKAVANTIINICNEHGILLAAQCCEHLNRALIVERETAEKFGYEIVSVVPKPKAGGSFATAVYEEMNDPVAVEFVKADAGLDIGSTLIGMHLKHVAVPLRLSVQQVGNAYVTAAKTRYKYIGGERANYK